MGSGHEFRNPDRFQKLGYRDWLREQMPHSRFGYVAEDLDLVLRCFGHQYDTDATGKFKLLELKYGTCSLGTSKERTFGLVDDVLRIGDPVGERYAGFYVVNYDDEDWDKASFTVNGQGMTRDEFATWMNWGANNVTSYFGR